MNTLLQKIALIVIALAFSASAFALTLQQAKDQAVVGEQPDGYLGMIVQNPEVEQLVQTVNDKRKQVYLQIARKNNVKLDQVAARAGERNLEKTQPGHMIQNQEGQWIKK